MTDYPSGQIHCGNHGLLRIYIQNESWYIDPSGLGRLVFGGERVRVKLDCDSSEKETIELYLNASGRAVLVALGRQRYMIPREHFLAVAFGEQISGRLFGMPGSRLELDEPEFPGQGESP